MRDLDERTQDRSDGWRHSRVSMDGAESDAALGYLALQGRTQPAPQLVAALQHLAGNRAVAGMVTAQRTPATDMADAAMNRRHVKNETYPGLVEDLKTVNNRVRDRINAYAAGHGGAQPGPGSALTKAAAGLKAFSENLIESADGKWTEAGEMARQILNKNRIPIPARNNATDADIEYSKHGAVTGVEAKAVNSATTAQVTAVLNAADAQLALRLHLARGKARIWIAHTDNRWPGIPGFAGRTTDAQVEADVAAHLNGMTLHNVDAVTLLMVRVPAGHPSMGGAVDVRATGGHGGWVAQVINVH